MREIVLNGEKTTTLSSTIQELLVEHELADKKVAIERNKKIVPRSGYVTESVNTGDRIEIVNFVGGG